jgi:hypothetical protein
MASWLSCVLFDARIIDHVLMPCAPIRDNYVQWLRFLWESYRTCLEVLKNNTKLEELYADTAKKTFMFCVTYKRKVEFRRLKDLLKTHLHMAPQSYSQPISENTLRLRVEIRAEQLHAATKLDLWQLAFESAEELHNVISHPGNRKVLNHSVYFFLHVFLYVVYTLQCCAHVQMLTG